MAHAVVPGSAVARYWQGLARTLFRLNRGDTMNIGHVRAPARDGIHEDGRQTLALLRGCSQTIRVILVALTDGVELEVWADGTLRRRSRFLRDGQARKYCDRLADRLTHRGYSLDTEGR